MSKDAKSSLLRPNSRGFSDIFGPMIPVALSIAGSDPSGGAGIQADIKTFHQFGVYATTVLTLVAVQNTQSVKSVELLSPALVEAQLDAVLEDIPPDAAKTGALGDENIIAAVARRAAGLACPLVVDPVALAWSRVYTVSQ